MDSYASGIEPFCCTVLHCDEAQLLLVQPYNSHTVVSKGQVGCWVHPQLGIRMCKSISPFDAAELNAFRQTNSP